MMKSIVFIIFVVSCLSSCDYSKKQYVKPKAFADKIQELVLSENNVDTKYTFKVTREKEILEYEITYIGNLNVNNENRKVIFMTILSGNESPQANSYLVFYNMKNTKLGHYYLGSDNIPKIQGDSLFFSYMGTDCNQSTVINFKDSIPKNIFIHCKEDSGKMFGNIYVFEKE